MWKVWSVLYSIFAKYLPESRRCVWAKKTRNFFARKIMLSCDKTANIERNAHFGPCCSVGKRSGVGVKCELYGPVTIGNDVMMGPECVVFTQNHKIENINIPMIEQGYDEPKPVIIEDDVWIGQRCIILPGVTLKKGCVLAAGAVLTKSTTPYSVWGGVPAKKIKDRI